MLLPWSQYWSLASFSAKSIDVRILVCRAHLPISSTFLFAIRQLLVMGFELMSVLGMGRGFPGPVIPPIFHISTCYLRAFISLLATVCSGCLFSMTEIPHDFPVFICYDSPWQCISSSQHL